MKFFLSLKHWQLFIITWGLPLIVNIYSFSKPMILFQLQEKIIPTTLILILLAGCSRQMENAPGYSEGVCVEYLDLINKGPKGTSIEYHQRDVIKQSFLI